MKPVVLNKLLEDLKQLYTLYEPFWNEWYAYKYCRLTQIDKYVLEKQKEVNFLVGPAFKVMLYNNTSVLKNTKRRLKNGLPKYKEWAVVNFQFLLIDLAKSKEFEPFFKIPIYDLPISNELRETLIKFNCKTIDDIVLKYSDGEMANAEIFPLILEFKRQHNIIATRVVYSKKGKIMSEKLKPISNN